MADNYIQRGERQSGYRSRGELPPGYRPASGRIDARQTPETTTDFAGLNAFHTLQDRSIPAFSRPGDEGVNAQDMARRATGDRVLLDYANGARERRPDTMTNRSRGSRGVPSHMDKYGNELAGAQGDFAQSVGGAPTPASGGMTADQQRWADNTSSVQRSATGAVGGGMSGIGGAAAAAASRAFTNNPYSGNRETNVSNAKTAGEFGGIRDAFNRGAVGDTSMDQQGGITRDVMAERQASLQPMANEISQRRADMTMATRGGVVANGSDAVGNPQRFLQNSPYGTGSAVDLPQGQRGAGLVNDHMGRAVQANPYLAEQRGIQDTKMAPFPNAAAPKPATRGQMADSPPAGQDMDEKKVSDILASGNPLDLLGLVQGTSGGGVRKKKNG